MKLEEPLQRIQSLYSKGVQSQSSRLRPRHIYSALLSARATLLSQQANKNQMTNQWLYQTLPCIELIPAPVHECPCVPANGCSILRSKHKLPMPISGMDDHLIQSVTTLDGSIEFTPTTFEDYRYSAGNKYTSKSLQYFIRNSFLYVTIVKHLKAVTSTGLYFDPVEAKMFPSLCPCEDCECQDIYQWDFPLIDGELSTAMYQIASNELIALFKQMNEDNSSNAADDAASTGMIHNPNQQNE